LEILELHAMNMAADNKGIVKEGQTARLKEVDDQKMEVVFLPAFDIDLNKVNPDVARALTAEHNRITDAAIRRKSARAQEGLEK